MINVQTLGEISVCRGHERVRLPTRKQHALLIYLVSNQGRPLRRSTLTHLLWETSPTSQARQSLRQAMYSIRQALPELSVHASTTELWLPASSVYVDAAQLELAVQELRDRDVLAVYRGDFLDGFWVEDAPAFEAWQESERFRLARAARRSFRRLMDVAEAEGDWGLLELTASRILRWDPLDEKVHRARLQAIALSEGRIHALTEGNRLISLLQEEVGRLPEPETLELLHRIDETVVRPPGPLDEEISLPLLGRADELAKMQIEWTAASAGQPRLLAVIGEGGIGKSRLCDAFLRFAAIRGGRILRSRCFASESQIPYSGIVDAMLDGTKRTDVEALPAAWAGIVYELLPEFRPERSSPAAPAALDGEGARRRLFEALSRLVERICEHSPTVLFLDDFQWADGSTITFIHYLLRRLEGKPLLVIVALRPEGVVARPEIRTLLFGARAGAAIRRLDIRELGTAAVGKLIDSFEERTGCQLSNALRGQIEAQAGGNPFFLLETLKALQANEFETDDSALSATLPHENQVLLAASIEEFLGDRLRELSTNTMHVLSCLAVIGQQAALEVIRMMIGATTDDIADELDELAVKGFLIERKGEFAFAHDLVREAAYRSIPVLRRRTLHGRIADIISDHLETQSGLLAFHYDLAVQCPLAYQHAMSAAQDARRVYAHSEAEHYLRMAVRNASNEVDRLASIDSLGTLLYENRRLSEAKKYLEELHSAYVTAINTPAVVRIKTMLLGIMFKKGETDNLNLICEFEALVDLAQAINDHRQLQILLTWITQVAHDEGSWNLIMSTSDRLLTLARQCALPIPAANALRAAARVIAMYNSVDQAIPHANEAVRLAEQAGEPGTLISALSARAVVRFQAGKLAEAERDFETALELAERTVALSSMHSVLNDFGVLLVEKGDYERAEQVFERTQSLARDAEATHDLIFVHGNLMLLAYERRDIGGARRYAEQILGSQTIPAWWCTTSAWSILGLCALDRGQIAEANRFRREVLGVYEARSFRVSDASYAEVFLARMAVLEGEEEAALQRLDGAITVYAGRDFFCLSRLRLELARLLLGRDPQEARRIAAAVRTQAETMGAWPLVRRAESIRDTAVSEAGFRG